MVVCGSRVETELKFTTLWISISGQWLGCSPTGGTFVGVRSSMRACIRVSGTSLKEEVVFRTFGRVWRLRTHFDFGFFFVRKLGDETCWRALQNCDVWGGFSREESWLKALRDGFWYGMVGERGEPSRVGGFFPLERVNLSISRTD